MSQKLNVLGFLKKARRGLTIGAVSESTGGSTWLHVYVCKEVTTKSTGLQGMEKGKTNPCWEGGGCLPGPKSFVMSA